MNIAVLAALPEELAPLAGRVASPKLRRPGQTARERVAGHDLRLLVTGAGAGIAGRRAAKLLTVEPPQLVLGLGAGGGLSSDLACGDLVVAEGVIDAATGELVEVEDSPLAQRARAIASARTGVIVSATSIAIDVRTKARLAALAPQSSAVVDLESLAWARAAAAARVPFLFVRGVTDVHDEPLPLDFESLRDDAGGIDRGRILRAALIRPVVWPRLLELRRRLLRVAESLATWTMELIAQ